MDIFCAVGTVEQTEQPNYLAEVTIGVSRSAVCCQVSGMCMTVISHNRGLLGGSARQDEKIPSPQAHCWQPIRPSPAVSLRLLAGFRPCL
eukprot:1159963-Pelagomonas_calceolata.AAC.4